MGRAYLLSLVVLFMSGLIYSLVLGIWKEVNSLYLLGFVSTCMATIFCGIVNLIYFIKPLHLLLRLISPGIISFAVVFELFYSSIHDLMFFSFFAGINLLFGLVVLIKGKIR
ncbi:MAG: hypothetical protein ACJA0U_000144 [Salibacteraceae bacterium]|jgi:hypothetical protein